MSSAAATAPCTPVDPERDMGVSFKLRSKLSVVRVAHGDELKVRDRPGPGAKAIGALTYDARNVLASGRVCRIGESTWFEVSRGSTKGWANGAFLVPTPPPRDVTLRLSNLLGSDSFASAEELTTALARALEKEPTEPSESPFEAKLIGISRHAGIHAVLYVCCQADDSIMGEQIFLTLKDDGKTVSLFGASSKYLCWRGTSDTGLCL